MKLIDADILIAELKESAFHHCNNPREDSLLQRDRVIVRAQPTVKAIPKADYEARLKADMVDMLEQLDLEIQEQIAYMGDGEEANGMKRADNLVKDKINTIKQSIWQDNYNGPKEVEQ